MVGCVRIWGSSAPGGVGLLLRLRYGLFDVHRLRFLCVPKLLTAGIEMAPYENLGKEELTHSTLGERLDTRKL